MLRLSLLPSSFPPPSLSLYFLLGILRFKRLRSGKKTSANNYFSLMLTHNLGTKYCHVVLKWQYWFSCWFRDYIMVDWRNMSKTASMFALALIELQIDFSLNVGLWLHLSYGIYFRKLAIVNSFSVPLKYSKSSPILLSVLQHKKCFSQGHENHSFEMYISKNTVLLSLNLSGRLRA